MDRSFLISFIVTTVALLLLAPEAAMVTRRSGRGSHDSTSLNPERRRPIDPRMPNMPPA